MLPAWLLALALYMRTSIQIFDAHKVFNRPFFGGIEIYLLGSSSS